MTQMAATKAVAREKPDQDRDRDIKALAGVDQNAAFDMLVRRYRSRLFYHAMYITKDRETAMDVAQEVFIRAHRCEQLFGDDFRVRAWLFRVTTNLCLNLIRDRKRRGTLLESFGRAHQPEPQPTGNDHILNGERRIHMVAALDKLSEKHRTILMLKYWQDLSYAEIADVLEVRLGTVMSRLSRAKRRLHDVLGEEDLL